MDWTDGHVEGFALAAAVAEDRAAVAAASGVCAHVRERVTATSEALASGDRASRRRWVRQRLGRAMEPAATQAGRPPRALSLLATRVAPELGAAWLRGAPLPRAGFVADATLLQVLAAIAARPTEGPEAA